MAGGGGVPLASVNVVGLVTVTVQVPLAATPVTPVIVTRCPVWKPSGAAVVTVIGEPAVAALMATWPSGTKIAAALLRTAGFLNTLV